MIAMSATDHLLPIASWQIHFVLHKTHMYMVCSALQKIDKMVHLVYGNKLEATYTSLPRWQNPQMAAAGQMLH